MTGVAPVIVQLVGLGVELRGTCAVAEGLGQLGLLALVLRFLKLGLGKVADQLAGLLPKRLRYRGLGLHILFNLIGIEGSGPIYYDK